MALTKPLTKPRRCRVCGTPLRQPQSGRPRTYCRASCRQKAYTTRKLRRPAVWHSRQSDEWATPGARFKEWDHEFGPFTLDAAATADNALCPRFFTVVEDGLAQPWEPRTWVNPPYSTVAKWVKKGYEESLAGATVVMLVPARTDTGWWHDYAVRANEIRYLRGRLKFGEAKSSAPFPSALLVFLGRRETR